METNKCIPKIAVLLSSYNGSRFIQTQIDSILNQKDVFVTLFIRDDGSNDERTLKLLDEYNENPNIIVKKERNIGLAKSFMNLVYEVGTEYDYYCFSDQDDIWLEYKLIKAIEKIKEKKIPTLYVSNQTLIDSNGNYLAKRHKKLLSTGYKQILCNNLFSGCTMVWNELLQEILIQYKPSDELLQKRIHDVWVGMVASVVGTIIYDDESYILYRQHENNVVGVKKSKKLKEYIKKFKNSNLRNGRSILAKEIYLLLKDKILDDSIKEELNYIGNYQESKKLKKKLLKDLTLYKYTGESKLEYKIKVRFNLF
ncbi:MAG: glycosyltransferase [Anaeroplasmataceae bacterium]|nr:glycosyltransferase [Anaeroplasmataceae bacterium]